MGFGEGVVAEGWQGGVLFLSKIRYTMGCQTNKNEGFTSWDDMKWDRTTPAFPRQMSAPMVEGLRQDGSFTVAFS